MKWISLLLVMVSLSFVSDVWAQGCTVNTIPVVFGKYDPSDPSPLDAIGTITVPCEAGVAFTISIDPGIHSGNSFNPRKMQLAGGGDTLDYNLYRDATHREIWGDGTSGTFVQTGIGTGSPQNFVVYGQLAAKQNVVVGSYSDSLTVTVEW